MNTRVSEPSRNLSTRASWVFAFWLSLARRLIYLVDGPARPYSDPRDATIETPEISSGGRVLEGNFVPGMPVAHAAVLIFHGLGDRLFYWKRAQFYLAEAGISSLVFHYSGYGATPGRTTPENLHQDSVAGYGWLVKRTGNELPVFLLGFSLGSGVAVDVAPALRPIPRGIILCQAYPTLRLAARRLVGPLAPMARMLPDVWRSTDTIAALALPLLIVHSDGDRLFPLPMGKALYEAAINDNPAPVEFAIPHGHPHNWIYAAVPPDYWAPILDFISRFTGN